VSDQVSDGDHLENLSEASESVSGSSELFREIGIVPTELTGILRETERCFGDIDIE
jgi:hypothetical protein